MYSVAATVNPQWFPEGFQTDHGVPTYFETAVAITVLVLLGQVLESRARHRTGAAIRSLLNLSPQTARVVLPDHDTISTVVADSPSAAAAASHSVAVVTHPAALAVHVPVSSSM